MAREAVFWGLNWLKFRGPEYSGPLGTSFLVYSSLEKRKRPQKDRGMVSPRAVNYHPWHGRCCWQPNYYLPAISARDASPHPKAGILIQTTHHTTRQQIATLPVMGKGALSRPLGGEAPASGGPLGKIGKFASRNKFDLLLGMRNARREGDLTMRHDVFRCSCGAIPGKELSIDRYVGGEDGMGHHAYRNLRRCASAMVCPVCGASLRYLRGQELQAIGEKMIRAGYSFVFVTYTARHGVMTDFHGFVKAFQAAQRKMKSGKAWQTLKTQYGLRFAMRTVEVTDDNPTMMGPRSGFHFHAHTVMWLDHAVLTSDEGARLEAEIGRLWRAALTKVGLEASEERGVVLELPRIKGGVLDKTEAMQGVVHYLCKRFSDEMTGDLRKSGQAGRRISIWELLRMAAETKSRKLWRRWQTYAEAMKGVSFLQLTPGLRDFCGLGREKTDEELLQGIAGEPVRTLTSEEFFWVVKQGGQGKLLRKADEAGLAGIEQGLKAAREGFDIETGEELEPPPLLVQR